MNLQCSSIFMLQRLLASLSLVILCSLFSPATADATVGGPDDGGYVFVDSLEAQCDTTFTDISNTGTPLDLFYDGGRHIILPFDFTFYGQTSADVYIRNEGFVLFDTTDFGTIYTSDVSLPTPIIYRPGWFPYWDELAHDTGIIGPTYFSTLVVRSLFNLYSTRIQINLILYMMMLFLTMLFMIQAHLQPSVSKTPLAAAICNILISTRLSSTRVSQQSVLSGGYL